METIIGGVGFLLDRRGKEGVVGEGDRGTRGEGGDGLLCGG